MLNGLIGLGVILSLYILCYFYLFISIDGRIVEDKPFLEKMCKIKPLCSIGTGAGFPCEVGVDISEDDPTYKKLISWKGFKGCNESTKGYIEIKGEFTGRLKKRIKGIKTCGCENIIG